MRLTPRARQTRAPQERSAPAPNICIEPEDDQTVTRSAGGKKLRAAFAAFWSAAQRPWESVARPPGLRRGRGRIHRAVSDPRETRPRGARPPAVPTIRAP